MLLSFLSQWLDSISRPASLTHTLMSLKLPSSPAFSLTASHTQVGGPTYSTQIFLLDIMKSRSLFSFSSLSSFLHLTPWCWMTRGSMLYMFPRTVRAAVLRFLIYQPVILPDCRQVKARWVASGYRGPILYYLGNIQETPTNCMWNASLRNHITNCGCHWHFRCWNVRQKYFSDDYDPAKECIKKTTTRHSVI